MRQEGRKDIRDNCYKSTLDARTIKAHMEIVEALPADIEDLLSVERAAFSGEEEAQLVCSLLKDPSAHPVLSLLARNKKQPVGHILFTSARFNKAPQTVSASILAPLAVVPAEQRKGIGGMLIESGLERLSGSGVELVFVLGHPEYYPCHGFEPASPYGLTPPFPVSPQEAWMVRALSPGMLGSIKGMIRCALAMNDPKYWRE